MSDTVQQPESFAFTTENKAMAERIIARYPEGCQRSAVLPLLDLAQRQNDNWLPGAAVRYVADMLEMAEVRVWEVATFYTMFNLEPVGRACIEVCTTTPCWLRGSEEIVAALEDEIGCTLGETTKDGAFTLREVECLGACVHAPMLQLGDDYFEDLTPEDARQLVRDFRDGKTLTPGSKLRSSAAPVSGPKVLTGGKE